jgi:hypothetical protein
MATNDVLDNYTSTQNPELTVAQQEALKARAAQLQAYRDAAAQNANISTTSNADGSTTTVLNGYTGGNSEAVAQEELHSQLQSATASASQLAAAEANSSSYSTIGEASATVNNVVDRISGRGPDVDRTKGLALVSQDAETQYSADRTYLEQAYNDGIISTTEYRARIEYLNNAMSNGTYMQDRGGGVRDVGFEYNSGEEDIVAENPSPLDEPLNPQTLGISTGIGSNAGDEKVINTDAYISSYSGTARLINFTRTDGSDDDNKLGYIKLLDTGNFMSGVASGENKQNLDAIYSALKARYNRFIITAIQESRSERSMIQATVGDSFAATFSGREPMVLAVQGLLICDHDKSKLTWYHAFMNAYEHYLRASRLAKYRVRMKLVLPDFTDYTGYMLNIGTSITSDNDMVIPMNFSMLVCNEAFNKAYGIEGSGTSTDSVVTITPDSTVSGAKGTTGTADVVGTSDLANVVPLDSKTSAASAAVTKTANVSAAGTAALDPAAVGAAKTKATVTASKSSNTQAALDKLGNMAQRALTAQVNKMLGTNTTSSILGSRLKGGVRV